MSEIKKITTVASISRFNGTINIKMKIDRDLHKKCTKHNNSYNEIIFLQLIRDYYE